MSDGLTGDWCEVGWTQGGMDANGQISNSFHVYSAFQRAGNYVESDMPYAPGAIGTVHTYQILRVYGTNVVQTYIDSIAVATCPGPVPADTMTVGLEYTDETAVNQGVAPHNILVHGYANNTWSSWGLGEQFNCIIGRGAYLMWAAPPSQQFADSSNILPHNEGAQC